MIRKLNVKLSIVLLLAMAASLFAGVVSARSEGAIVEVFRLNRIYIEVKITLPGGFDVNAKYGGMISGKYLDCRVVSADVLICIGPYRAGSDSALLTIYDKATKENILQQVIAPPPPVEHEGDPKPSVPVCPPEECPLNY